MSTQDHFTPTMPGGVFDQAAVQEILDNTDPNVWVYELTLADRCDRCGAQAFVAVQVEHGEVTLTDEQGTWGAPAGHSVLLFCGHHGNTHKVALEVQATAIVDHTHRINEKPSQSSGSGAWD